MEPYSLSKLRDITRICKHSYEQNNPVLTCKMHTILHNTLGECEDTYFQHALSTQLSVIFEQERALMKQILMFIYVTIATFPIK